MKHRIAVLQLILILAGLGLVAASASAQTLAYRQTNLASSAQGFANHLAPGLSNPWGITFLQGQPFFIAENKSGRVTQHDAAGSSLALAGFTVPKPDGTGPDNPVGIVADQNSDFGGPSLVQPYIVVAEDGTIYIWGPDAHGNILTEASLARDDIGTGAVYKGVALLHSALTSPALAVTDFHGGFVQTFLPGFAPVVLPGSFTDPNLPAGYAPYGIRVIGNQVYVTYALQDAAKHDPVVGAGNGIVSIFSIDGIFVRRFATGGHLNAPYGVAQASAQFGPFSNDILISNTGDGTISAFDPANGTFLGQIEDGNGNAIVNPELHDLTFRADEFGDPNTLYFTAGLNNGQQGLFGSITAGSVSTARVSVPATSVDVPVTITATVAAGAGNSGVPTGTVSFGDGGILLGSSPLVDGVATMGETFAGVGIHTIDVQYSGDVTFLASDSQATVQVAGIATSLTLMAPASVAPGSPVTLSARINSTGGAPTGNIAFLDGNQNLGSAALNATGTASITVPNLAAGAHLLTATYAGAGNFAGSVSAVVTTNVSAPDFSVGAAPTSVTVTAGQSAPVTFTVTPANGFSGTVSFSCSSVPGITCSFNPTTVAITNGPASTMAMVITAPTTTRYGFLPLGSIGLGGFFIAAGFLCVLVWRAGKFERARVPILTMAAVILAFALSLSMEGCGYGSNYNAPQNAGPAMVTLTAQSGTISHSTMVSVTVH